jgi:polysaccharide export outer membrane protein
MRVARSFLPLLAVALAVAGCAAQAPYVQTAPTVYGIDAVTYGTPQSRQAYPQQAYPQQQTYAAQSYSQPQTDTNRGFLPQLYASQSYPQQQSYTAQVYAQATRSQQTYTQPSTPVYAAAATPSAGYTYGMAQGPYTLDSGDRLRIVVFGQDGLTNSYAVDASGHIAMPLIGTVAARGLTTDQLAGAVSAKLRDGFIREPHVAVEIEAYRPFFILGEVTQPGQYPYVANMTVETAVAIAGGFGPRASHESMILSRSYNGQQVRMAVPPNYPLRPGDTVSVRERWF